MVVDSRYQNLAELIGEYMSRNGLFHTDDDTWMAEEIADIAIEALITSAKPKTQDELNFRAINAWVGWQPDPEKSDTPLEDQMKLYLSIFGMMSRHLEELNNAGLVIAEQPRELSNQERVDQAAALLEPLDMFTIMLDPRRVVVPEKLK